MVEALIKRGDLDEADGVCGDAQERLGGGLERLIALCFKDD